MMASNAPRPSESEKELPIEYRQVFSELKALVYKVQHPNVQVGSMVDDLDNPVDQVTRLGTLYLKASAMFAWIKTQPGWRRYVSPMQRVLVDANVLLYPEERSTFGGFMRGLFLVVPAQFWKDRYFHLLSTAICLISAFISFWLVLGNFELAAAFMPAAIRDTNILDAYFFSADARHEMLTYGRDAANHEKAMFAFFLMQNNIKVAVLCFTSGLLFGIPTLLMLIETGLMLWTLPALFYPTDIVQLGAWLAPHGVPEVGAILLAGGGGLRIAYTLLNPGDESTSKAVQRVMKELTGTVVVIALFLIWAGVVESFVRQSYMGTSLRYAIAGISVVPFVMLFLWGYLANQMLGKDKKLANA